MTCQICGDLCRCTPGERSAPRWLADDETRPAEPAPPALLEPSAAVIRPHPGLNLDAGTETPSCANTGQPPGEDSSAWRQEVASSLNRYQARRGPRQPRYPSLRLPFDQAASARAKPVPSEPPNFPPALFSSSNHALALDGFPADEIHAASAPSSDVPSSQAAGSNQSSLHQDEVHQPYAGSAAATPAPAKPQVTAKIIEFPRSWTPPPPPQDELAEPVIDRPRILEAPDFVPPAPALGGITIEPLQKPDLEKRPGIDIPLESASLARRIFAAAVDDTIIVVACILFGAIFYKMTPLRPPRLQILGMAAGFAAVFWAAYQYLLIVHSGSTPGLRAAGLELARFDGRPANRRLRRWRVLASFLSAVSLGMGYAWVFLDEDALCWHDRITRTYLAPKTARRAVALAGPNS